MKLRLTLVALIVLAASAVVVFRNPLRSVPTPRTVTASAPESVATPIAIRVDSSLTFSVLREHALAPYRLRPDRRWLLAVGEIRRLAGVPDSALAVQFADGRWKVGCGSQVVGSLTELPDFPEMLDVLTDWARTQAWAHGWSDNGGPERAELAHALDRLDAPGALREADRAWSAGSRDAALFRDAAHAFALLSLETPEWDGRSDLIAARGMAMLAFARALGSDDPRRESCLMAAATGYPAAARQWARSLPANDPLRLYVSGDDTGLERLAGTAGGEHAHAPIATKAVSAAKPARSAKTHSTRSSVTAHRHVATATAVKAAPAKTPATANRPTESGSLEAAYYDLLRVASRDDAAGWSARVDRLARPGVPQPLVLSSGLGLQDSEARRAAGERMLAAMTPRAATAHKTAARATPATAAPTSLAARIQRVESMLEAPGPGSGSTLYGAEIARDQRRTLAYAALDAIARHTLETGSSAEIARAFATGSTKHTARRVVAVERWYAHLAGARVGRVDLAALRADVDSAASGPRQALASYEALRSQSSPDDAGLRQAARDLARRMDTRPEHRVTLGSIAAQDVGALTVAERLGTSAGAAGLSDPALLAWKGRLRNDDSSRVAASTRRSTRGGDVARETVSGPELLRRLTLHPGSWDAAERYAGWLEDHHKYGAARGVLERWMTRTRGDSASAASTLDARVRIAHLHQLEGHPKEGLQVLGDLYRTGSFPAAERTALILEDLGQSNQALAIAWAAHRRDPSLPAGRGLLAELLWRQGSVDEAAKVLSDGPSRLSSADWSRDVAPRFVTVFRGRDREGLEAADALMRAGWKDRSNFGAIPEALGAEGLHALAFELQSRLQPPGADGFECAILAYGHLKAAKGEAAAVAWLKTKVADDDRDLLGILAYQEGYSELLWSMAPSRMQGEVGDYHWLLRAATCLAAGSSHPYYAETVNHVNGARGAYHLEIARYLLGLREESEVLAMAQTTRQRAELCYFAGLKAEQRGRRRDAADWYFMSVESDTGNNIESRWSLERLRAWTGEGAKPGAVPALPPTQAPPA